MVATLPCDLVEAARVVIARQDPTIHLVQHELGLTRQVACKAVDRLARLGILSGGADVIDRAVLVPRDRIDLALAAVAAGRRYEPPGSPKDVRTVPEILHMVAVLDQQEGPAPVSCGDTFAAGWHAFARAVHDLLA